MNKEEKEVATETTSQPEEVVKPNNNSFNNFLAKGKEVCGKICSGENVKYLKIACIALVLIIACLLVKCAFSGNKDTKVPDYSYVYENKDGNLMLVNANSKEAAKITKVDDSSYNVVYANETNKYILYDKDGVLYILNTKKADSSKKIDKDVYSYSFTSDDKYVYYINKDNNLYVYNMKKNYKIDGNVDEVLATTEDKIIYLKSNKLYVASLKDKNDAEKIDSNVYNAILSEDGKYLLYDTKDSINRLKISNLKSEEMFDEDIYPIDYNDDFSQMIASDDDEILYYKNGKETKLADDVSGVLWADVDTLQMVYGKSSDDSKYSSTYDLYYQKGTKDAVKIGSDIKLDELVVLNNKDIYYLESDGSESTLYYAKISGAKISGKSTKISSEVNGSLYDILDKGLLYLTGDDSDDLKLMMVSGSKTKEVAKGLNAYSTINGVKSRNKVYFISDYEDGEGKLNVFDGSKSKEVSKDVSSIKVINDKLVYILKNGSDSEKELYILKGTKETRVAKDVVKTASGKSYIDIEDDSDYNDEDYSDYYDYYKDYFNY